MDIAERLRQALALAMELRLKAREARSSQTDAAAEIEAADREIAQVRKALAGIGFEDPSPIRR